MSDTDPVIPNEMPDTLVDKIELGQAILRNYAFNSVDFADDPDFINNRRDSALALELATSHGNHQLLEILLKEYIDA